MGFAWGGRGGSLGNKRGLWAFVGLSLEAQMANNHLEKIFSSINKKTIKKQTSAWRSSQKERYGTRGSSGEGNAIFSDSARCVNLRRVGAL